MSVFVAFSGIIRPNPTQVNSFIQEIPFPREVGPQAP